MSSSDRAGQPASSDDLIDVDALIGDYYDLRPDPDDPTQLVSFGTSGHRGSAFDRAFNEAHIVAISQAICDYRNEHGITGPLFVARDSHALSAPAFDTSLEVLVANGVDVLVDDRDGFTPTPSLSRAILRHNRAGSGDTADGVVITPSHNPPRDGGFKYNPPNGGPADAGITGWIQDRANDLLRDGVDAVRRTADAREAVSRYDFLGAYVDELPQVVDMAAIRDAGVNIGVHPLGGASVEYWRAIGERHDLHLDLVDDTVDPAFGFMTLDHDGKIRMDCSSPYAMRSLIDLAGRFDVAFGNDADADRHGIVTPAAGLMNPNHYLAVAIAYLLEHRDGWPRGAGIGKTLVSSSIIDRVVVGADRMLIEVPVGFKWFVDGLLDGSIAFGGEESAGASFLQTTGDVWTTDKDGLILCLLAAEIIATTGQDPADHYAALTDRYGAPVYRRVDSPASAQRRAALKELSPDDISATELAGERIEHMLTRAPGNDAPIGGLKVVTASGWFAARPSGTEDISKIYAESFAGEAHLERILSDAQDMIAAATAH